MSSYDTSAEVKAQCTGNLCTGNSLPRTVLCSSFEVSVSFTFIHCKSYGQQHSNHVMILTFLTLYVKYFARTDSAALPCNDCNQVSANLEVNCQ